MDPYRTLFGGSNGILLFIYYNLFKKGVLQNQRVLGRTAALQEEPFGKYFVLPIILPEHQCSGSRLFSIYLHKASSLPPDTLPRWLRYSAVSPRISSEARLKKQMETCTSVSIIEILSMIMCDEYNENPRVRGESA